jgi:drug/metabolite transporter (DMT)-like permease
VIGAAAALFAAISWGIYSNLGRFVSVKPGLPAGRQAGRRPSGAADVQTFAAMTVGVAMLAAALAAMGMLRSPAGYQTPLYFLHWGPAAVSAWAVAAGMGLLLYGLGFTLWLAALELGRAAGQAHRLPPLTYLTPILTVTNGWIVLHQTFGPGFWWGALLIAGGNLLIALPTSGAGSQPADSAPTSG